MSCFYPKELFVTPKGELNAIKITAPCGKCLGCYIDTSAEWSMRAQLELRNHSRACFITLTYDERHVPDDLLLKRKDVQDFLKRLRRHIEPIQIRYYGCGEYGSNPGELNRYRPHYHLIIYGWQPDDLKFMFKNEDGDATYKSDFLNRVWSKGIVNVGNVTKASIRYCSLYLQKQFKDLFKDKAVQPFRVFSTRPALGYGGLRDEEIVNDAIYLHGKKRKLPRSFMNRLENNEWSEVFLDIKERRKEKSEFIQENCIDPWRDICLEISQKKKSLDFYVKKWYNDHKLNT